MILSQSVPPVSKEFAQSIVNAFRPLAVKPGVKMDDLQYNAGQQRVVEFVLYHANQVTAKAEDELPETVPGVLQRIKEAFVWIFYKRRSF